MSQGLLTEQIKDAIQDAYRTWLGARDFKPRRGQREMIAQIARTLGQAETRICVVEAGTGTGKTAAYCLAAIPLASTIGKTVVVSTATVALQEQVVLQDLPDLKQRAGLAFSVSLAKGRGRYVFEAFGRSPEVSRSAGNTIFDVSNEDFSVLYQEMLNRYPRAVGMASWTVG